MVDSIVYATLLMAQNPARSLNFPRLFSFLFFLSDSLHYHGQLYDVSLVSFYVSIKAKEVFLFLSDLFEEIC